MLIVPGGSFLLFSRLSIIAVLSFAETSSPKGRLVVLIEVNYTTSLSGDVASKKFVLHCINSIQ